MVEIALGVLAELGGCPKGGRGLSTLNFAFYLCGAVRGAAPRGLAEMIPSEPDMYNDSAGKR